MVCRLKGAVERAEFGLRTELVNELAEVGREVVRPVSEGFFRDSVRNISGERPCYVMGAWTEGEDNYIWY